MILLISDHFQLLTILLSFQTDVYFCSFVFLLKHIIVHLLVAYSVRIHAHISTYQVSEITMVRDTAYGLSVSPGEHTAAAACWRWNETLFDVAEFATGTFSSAIENSP